MNLFKITLLGAMVAGLACANISAVNPQDCTVLGSHESPTTPVPGRNSQDSGAQEIVDEILNVGFKYTPTGDLRMACLTGIGAVFACNAINNLGLIILDPGTTGAEALTTFALCFPLVFLTLKLCACIGSEFAKAEELLNESV